MRNSSFRVLFPPNASPVRSSRLIQSRGPPRRFESRFISASGVGKNPSEHLRNTSSIARTNLPIPSRHPSRHGNSCAIEALRRVAPSALRICVRFSWALSQATHEVAPLALLVGAEIRFGGTLRDDAELGFPGARRGSVERQRRGLICSWAMLYKTNSAEDAVHSKHLSTRHLWDQRDASRRGAPSAIPVCVHVFLGRRTGFSAAAYRASEALSIGAAISRPADESHGAAG